MESVKMKITLLGDAAWQVDLTIPNEKNNEDFLLQILRSTKKRIALDYKVDVTLLQYTDLTRTSSGENETAVAFNIIKDEKEKGDPVLRFLKARDDNGMEYKDMLVILDAFPMKKDGAETTPDDLKELFEREKLPPHKIDSSFLNEIITKLSAEGKAVLNLVLLNGTFPESGKDAEVKFNCEMVESDAKEKKSVGIIKVGGLICKKTMPGKSGKNGETVRGETIPPRNPRDIEIVPSENVVLTDDGLEVYAAGEGTIHVKISEHKDKKFKEKITISLNTSRVVDGKKPLNLTLDDPLTIIGGLKKGSKIISRDLVVIEGDVEAGVFIQTSGDIQVTGNVVGSTLSSSGMIEHIKDVIDSKLIAEGKIIVTGVARNSFLIGEDVIVHRIEGSTITAGRRIETDSIERNHDGFTGFLKVGGGGQKQEIVKENAEFIIFAKKNLDAFKKVFGDDIVDRVTEMNYTHMLSVHIGNLQKKGTYIPEAQKQTLKALLRVIVPIRKLMREKQMDNIKYSDIEHSEAPEDLAIIVNIPVKFPVKIEMEGEQDYITQNDGAVEARIVDGDIIKKPL